MNPFNIFRKQLLMFVEEDNIKHLEIQWRNPNRYYHTIDHLIQILKDIEDNHWFKGLELCEKNAILLAAFYHDAIYNPRAKDNEDQSKKYFLRSYKGKDQMMVKRVCELIEVTKYRKRPFGRLERILWDADNAIFKKEYDEILKNEILIRKEYKHLSTPTYKKGRIEFLESCIGLFGQSADKNIKKVINWVQKNY